jgi:hypothetical protein
MENGVRSKFLLEKFKELTGILNAEDIASFVYPHYAMLKIKLRNGTRLRFIFVKDDEWLIETENYWNRKEK